MKILLIFLIETLAFLPVFTGGTCPPHILNWGGQSPPRFEYLRFIILLILLGAQALKQYSSMREAPKHATGKANVAKVCYKSCKLSPYFARCEDTLPQLVNCHCWTIACSDIWWVLCLHCTKIYQKFSNCS